MSFSNRRLFLTTLLVPALALGACGFRPVYGPEGAGAMLRDLIVFTEPDDRNGYELVKRLEQRLGRVNAGRYSLSYQITTLSEGVGVTPGQEITRTQVQGAVVFAVVETGTDAVIFQGSVSGFTSYSTLGSTVSTASVQRDANRRLMVILADLIVTRLIATAPGWAE